MKKYSRITLGLCLLSAAMMTALPAMAQAKSHKDIKFKDLPKLNVPSPEIYTLENGMKVFLMEDHELPLISVNAIIRTGSNHMPNEKNGMGPIFGQVQREGGTTSMTGDEMNEFLEARAASVETGMGGDSASASMNCLVEDFESVFRVFADVLRNPAFAEEKIDLAKVQMNSSIARRNDNVGGIVGREFNKLIYGADSPLASTMEYATVAAVTRDDLVKWHAKYYHPNNVYLGVSGDFDPAKMKNMIQVALGDWAKGPAFSEGEVAYSEPKPGVYFVEKTDVTQANIRIGHLGIKRDDPDYYALQVMNHVMGAGFSGRLLQEIRSERGLAYSVFGGVGDSFTRRGVFQAGMSTKSETMAESTEALRHEIARMISEPPTKEEIADAKESILNAFVFNYTSRAQILGQQMTFDYFGLPLNYLDSYQPNIEKVTVEDVARATKKHLHPDKLVVLVVGNPADFDRPVASLGDSVQTIDIAIAPPPDKRPEVVRSAAALASGAEALNRMATKLINGAGGQLRSAKAKMSIVIKMGGQSMSAGQEHAFVLPNMVRMSVKLPMGEQMMVINGDSGTMSMGGQSAPVPEAQIGETLDNLNRNLLILASKSSEVEAVSAGAEKVGGTDCDLVSVSLGGIESRLCIDSSGKVLKQSYQGKHPLQGSPGLIEVVYSDYAELGGRYFPKTHSMMFEGQEVLTITVDSLEVNPDLDPAMFAVN